MFADLIAKLADARQAVNDYTGNPYSTKGSNLHRDLVEARANVAEAKRLANVAFWKGKGKGKQPPGDFAPDEAWIAWEQG